MYVLSEMHSSVCLCPYIERELLCDRARRLVWQSYLQMADLTFTSEGVPNADYMSPSGEHQYQGHMLPCLL